MKKEIENPWKGIEGPNFYTKEDQEKIQKFNKKTDKAFEIQYKRGNPYFIDIRLMPEPYIGNPEGNVILLFSNPGLNLEKKELEDYKNEKFKIALIKNLTHQNVEFPYFYLDPEFRDTAGGVWIRNRLQSVIDELKKNNGDEEGTIEKLSRKIFTLQLHPFHSSAFLNIQEPFSKHDYTMQLFSTAVEKAKKGKAIIVCTRSYKEWNLAYKKFAGVNEDLSEILKSNFIKTKNSRSPYITKGNLGIDNFHKLIEVLNETVN